MAHFIGLHHEHIAQMTVPLTMVEYVELEIMSVAGCLGPLVYAYTTANEKPIRQLWFGLSGRTEQQDRT
jgi:hypothetical protein